MIAPVAEQAAGKIAAKTAAKQAAKKGASKAAAGAAAKPGTGGRRSGSARAPKPVDPQQAAPQQANDLLGNLPGQLGSLGKDAADKVTLTPPKKLSAGDASGFAFGLIAYALFINYIRYGPAGVRGWIAAKFINKPLQEPPR